MGRELRMVPANWDHPKTGRGGSQPMYDKTFKDAAAEWKSGFVRWQAGERPEWFTDESKDLEFWEYEGDPPDRDYYRSWNDSEATWFQVWETVSEGTPVTPPFETEAELIDYLVENGDFWDQERRRKGNTYMNCKPWSRESAENFVLGSGWAPSFIADEKGVRSGVEALSDVPKFPCLKKPRSYCKAVAGTR